MEAIAFTLIGFVGGFVVGILVGHRNRQKVEKLVKNLDKEKADLKALLDDYRARH